jgi:hypothetical protein
VVRAPDSGPLPGAEVHVVAYGGLKSASAGNELSYVARPVEQQAAERLGRDEVVALRVVAGSEGGFTVEVDTRGVRNPEVKAVAIAKGYGLASQGWKDPAREIEIRMPKAVTVRGRLLTSNGTPAAGAVVKALSFGNYKEGTGIQRDTPDNDIPGYWPRPVKTDTDGRFTLAGAPASTHVTLDVTHPACAREELTIDTGLGATDGSRSFDIPLLPPTFSQSLSPARPVEGVVKAVDTGKPMANVIMEVIPMRRHGGMQVYTRTDSRGHYRVNDRAGSMYWVVAYPRPDSCYLAVTKHFDHWPAGAPALVHNVALPRGKLIRGRLLDGQTGRPIAGASIE